MGFPHLRVRRSIRLPRGIRRAFPLTVLLRLPVTWSTSPPRFRHRSVSGFPLPCLKSRMPYADASHAQEPAGPPKFFDISLPACHGLWTPADLHLLAISDASVLPSVCVKTLGVRNLPFRSCPSTSGDAAPPTACRILCLRLVHLVRRGICHDSAMDARLDTGGWLALPRQGLSPCKIRQAFLGATTPGFRHGGQRERGTSGRWPPSPANPCSA